MKVFFDRLDDGKAELLSDSYPMIDKDVVWEVNGTMVPADDNVEINIGANASAEEAEEELDSGSGEKVIDIVKAFRLTSTQFDYKGFLTYIKDYLVNVSKAVHPDNEDERKAYLKKCQGWVQANMSKAPKDASAPKFADWEFYIGETMNPEGMVVLLNYREDGTTPYLVFWKGGLGEIKV